MSNPTRVAHISSKQDFADLKKKASDEKKLLVVDFYATWCGPCKVIGPQVDELSVMDPYSNVYFCKVDVDEVESIPEEYQINCMPTFVFIKEGKKVADFSGANKDKLKELLDKHK